MTKDDFARAITDEISRLGLPTAAEVGIYLGLLLLGGLFANFVVKRLLLRLVERILAGTSFGQDKELRRHGVIPRLANIVPALFISAGLKLIPGLPDVLRSIISNVTNAFIILTLALAISGAITIFDTIYHRRPTGRARPIKSYIQIFKIAFHALAAIFIIATLIDKSPVILLSGLGAITAVLVLVFQDTLLSIVAGLQISSNDMVRVGDWIEMPGLNADGDVIEIALHTVKVQNWDKTITTIPIRKLATESFRNWRGMQESGGRRIKRAIMIDQSAVRFLSEAEIDSLRNLALIAPYLEAKDSEVASWNKTLGAHGSYPGNTRRLTNVGTFRAYMAAYLRTHPKLRSDMTLIVRQKDPSPTGVPIEIYCFTNTTDWVDYENIQSDIFDHILAILPEFGLRPFQNVSGHDLSTRVQST